MPTYTYKCQHCLTARDIIKPLALLDREEPCPACGSLTERQLAAPRVIGDYAGYTCPITGAWIEGKAAHKENLAKHGCRILEPGESADAARQRAHDDRVLENTIAESAAEFVANLPAQKQEQVATALSHNDVSFSRQ